MEKGKTKSKQEEKDKNKTEAEGCDAVRPNRTTVDKQRDNDGREVGRRQWLRCTLSRLAQRLTYSEAARALESAKA